MDQKRVRNELETRLGCQKRDRNDAETRSSWMDQIKPWMYAFEARVAVDPNGNRGIASGEGKRYKKA